ncbi:MAG: SURF1 family cytochrome oxidase biogenesis protein, partial [Microbacterium sp.]
MTDAVAPDVFPPTLREVLLRPRWLALLGLCLVVAGVFAWLGQWQLGRAIAASPATPGATEQVRPIAEVTAPGEYLPGPLVGQKVSVSGRWIPDDFIVVSSRVNDGKEGWWVTGQLRVDLQEAGLDTPTSLAVAVGWAATREEADAAASALSALARDDPDAPVALTGRLISDEGPAV